MARRVRTGVLNLYAVGKKKEKKKKKKKKKKNTQKKKKKKSKGFYTKEFRSQRLGVTILYGVAFTTALHGNKPMQVEPRQANLCLRAFRHDKF